MEPLAFNTAAPGSNPMFATTRGLDRNPEFSSPPWFSTPKLPGRTQCFAQQGARIESLTLHHQGPWKALRNVGGFAPHDTT